MKTFKVLFATVIMSASSFAMAEGWEDSTVVTDLENNGAVIAIEGEVKTGLVGSVKGNGTATSGSVINDVQNMKNTTVISRVKNNGAVIAVGNATAGSIKNGTD